MKTMRNILSLSIICLLMSTPVSVFAQSASTGALTGSVTDSNKGVVRDVDVRVTNEATGEERHVKTNDEGLYTIPLLLPGTYRVDLSKTGFKTASKKALRINVSETSRLDVELEVGEISTTIEVVAEAELLQTESSELGRVVNAEAIATMPLVTRNYTQIVGLSPGISASVGNATELGRGSGGESGGAFRAHGAFARDNNFQMNGVQINDLQASGFFSGGVAVPNPDAIQEFKVQTGQFDASFGRNAGANVNIVTKGGANKFHGTVFEFFRNDALNANDFFRNVAGQDRGVLRQNQFGFTLGGPVKKDKLLFFGSYQGTRQTNGVGGGSTSNFFSPPFTNDRSRAALGRLFAGRRGFLQNALGGVGPAVAADGSNISDQALAIFNLKLPNGDFIIPTPQSIDPTRAFDIQGFSAVSVPATFDEDQFIANLDFLHTDNSKIWGRFFYADSDLVQSLPATNVGGPPVPGFPLLTGNGFRNFSVAHTYTISQTLINQAEFGFHRINTPILQQEQFKWSDIGVNAPPLANLFPVFSVQGGTGTSPMTVGGNGQSVRINQDHYTFQDWLTYIRGRQTFRFGGSITRTHLNLTDFSFFGGLVFASWPDVLLGLSGAPVGAGGNGTTFSNVLLSFEIPGDLDRDWRVMDGNFFIQDDFKVTPALTLNLGLRYERLGNLGDIGGRNSGFDKALANPNPPAAGTLEGFIVSGNFPESVPSGVTQLDNRLGIRGEHQNNWAPRLGFAWRLPYIDRMVLRGGYGIYYTRATGQPFLQLAAGPPFASVRQIQSLSSPLNGALTFANPFLPEFIPPQFQPYSPTTGASIAFVDQEYRAPVTQQWSLNLQTDLGRNFLLETGYVGTRANHLIFAHGLNQADLASPSNPIRGVTTNTRGAANIAQRVPIRGFTAIGLNDIDSSANAWYHGLEVSVTKRLSRGLQFLAAYTFAHAYSDSAGNTSAAGGGVPGNQNDRRANYGRADFNREHRFVISYVYNLPSPDRFHPFVDGLLGGWLVAGVTTLQSGLPLTFTGNNALNVFGITNDRAQLAPGCTHDDLTTSGSVKSRLGNYFNKSCIARNAAGTAIWPIVGDDGQATTFGNSGVGIATGPGQNNTDIAVIKRTPFGWLGESGNVEFRTEFFNAFNHPQFGNPSTNVLSSAFGVISASAVNPRIIQFGLKVNF